MYGFPLDISLNVLVGDYIAQLCFGIGDVQIQFGGGSCICVQSEVDIYHNGVLIANWTQETLWSSLGFQKIYNKDVIFAVVKTAQVLEIGLDGGFSFFIFDSSDSYESAQIYLSDNTEVII